jgi:UDP-GlcNAc:undecaprenyl-phosphate/decaprenyl-phosphate GlcNAc-1-phosphate transferase
MAQAYGLSLLSHFPEAGPLFLGTFVASCALTGLLYFIAMRSKLLPAIRDRDVHTTRKPRVGGVAMWLAGALALWLVTALRPDLLQFAGAAQLVPGIACGMLVLLIFGLADDLFGLPASLQLIGQFLAALCLIAGGLVVSYLRFPFVDHPIYLDRLVWSVGTFDVHPYSALFTSFWIVAIINVMNFFDGLDGLTGSITVTGSAVLLLVSLRLGFGGAATLAVIVCAMAAGFLPWNWHPSKLFMGTVGSQLLGYMLGVIAIVSGAKVATAVLVLGIPVFDALIVILRRLAAHEKPWQADQRHLHHRLLKIGLTPPQVVLVTNAVGLIFGWLALASQQTNEKGILTVLLLLCIIGFLILTYVLEKRAAK